MISSSLGIEHANWLPFFLHYRLAFSSQIRGAHRPGGDEVALLARDYQFDLLEQIRDPERPEGAAELATILQDALFLEHATIPPYLTAAYSLDPAKNGPIRQLILRIAKEEMLHMAAIANLMNAIGIAPRLNSPDFIPSYPTTLPMLDREEDFVVDLRSFSREEEASMSLLKAFMAIEEPEDPLVYPLELTLPSPEAPPKPRTIGALYEEIIELLESDQGQELLANAEANLYKQLVLGDQVYLLFERVQVESQGGPQDFPLPEGIDLKIVDQESAVRHLKWIAEQGEGTRDKPDDRHGMPAHYYRFESILKGHYLVKDPTSQPDPNEYDDGYRFAGAPLQLDLEGVFEFDTNPTLDGYEGRMKNVMVAFQKDYADMVLGLNGAFNCESSEPPAIEARDRAWAIALSAMRQMPNSANRVVRAQSEDKLGGLLFSDPILEA